ncbi:EamA family transporter [Cellulomonas endophytica]|uniref:EamA family transporter n=1 Tax=Cellulomonas endophytica TaxID=2494735 RepID=UPI0010103F11|nr:EamA family transporter [Cellulomonas endophytica]
MTRVPAPALFVVSGLTQYVGAAVAVGLFAVLPAPTVAWLRVAVSALLLVAWRRPWREREPGGGHGPASGRPVWRGRRLGVAVAFGVALAVMNVAFYVAIDHLPLGTAVAVEFLGPVAVAALTGRGWRERGAVVVAAGGVALLAGVQLGAGPSAGVGLLAALGSAAAWAAYILLGRRVALAGGPGSDALAGLAVAMAAGGLVLAPVLAPGAAPLLADGRLLGLVVVVAVCSSLVPYGLEQLVLRRVSAATFAVLLALLPATATVVGAVGLRQAPALPELVGLALVSGAILLAGRPRTAGPEVAAG